MTFTEHLAELRTRIIRSGYALVVAVFLCYALSTHIYTFIVRPIIPLVQPGHIENDDVLETKDADGKVLPPEAVLKDDTIKFVALSPFEPVMVSMRIAMYGGAVLAMPFILFQVCGFIFPGLTGRERNAVMIMLLGGGALAVSGVALAYYFVFPVIIPVLKSMAPSFVETQFQMSTTLGELIYLLLGFAITFQFPMFVLILVYLDLLTPQTLVAQWRIAIVGIAVVAAVFTPPDAISMTIMMVPLLFLYVGSAIGAYAIVWSRKKKTATT